MGFISLIEMNFKTSFPLSLPTTIFSPPPTPSTQRVSFVDVRREGRGSRADETEEGNRGRSAAIRFHAEGTAAATAAAAAALRREITRGSLKTCRKSEVRLECSPVSLYMRAGAQRTCVRAFKERPRRRGDVKEEEERSPNHVRSRVCVA